MNKVFLTCLQSSYNNSTQLPYLHNLISVQRPRSTRSSSVVTLARPPTSYALKITDRSFRYASPCLWNRCSVCWTSAPLFDCVDRDILIKRPQQSFGIRGNALAWIRSFLHGRCQQDAYNSQLSALIKLLYCRAVFSARCYAHAELFEVIACFCLVGQFSPMTLKCTSVIQLRRHRPLFSASFRELNRSMPG